MNKKKVIIPFLVASLLLVTGEQYVSKAASDVIPQVKNTSIDVLVDARRVYFPDVQPQIKNGTTLIPLRFVSDKLGGSLTLNGKNITIVKGDRTIKLTIGSKQATVNGKIVNLNAASIAEDGRTLVPLRLVSEGFDKSVVWSSADRTVYITSPEGDISVPNHTDGEKDRFGREIRTTNLPKNYRDYPYILKDIPNEMYEMKAPTRALMPIDNQNDKLIMSTKVVEAWKDNVEQYYDLLLNVNYKEIDDQWAKDLFSHINQSAYLDINKMKDYVDWVKKNKIITEGNLKAEPSLIFYHEMSGKYFIRSSFKIKIVNYEKYKDIFYDLHFDSVQQFTKGTWYEGYADIPISTNVINSDMRMVDPNTSLFKNVNRYINPVHKSNK